MTVAERLLSDPEILRILRDLCPRGKGETVTFSSGGVSVVLTPETRRQLDRALKQRGPKAPKKVCPDP